MGIYIYYSPLKLAEEIYHLVILKITALRKFMTTFWDMDHLICKAPLVNLQCKWLLSFQQKYFHLFWGFFCLGLWCLTPLFFFNDNISVVLWWFLGVFCFCFFFSEKIEKGEYFKLTKKIFKNC